MFLPILTVLGAAANAAVAAGGEEYSAVEAGSVVGYEEGRRQAEYTVSTITELNNRVSYTSNDIMANGDTTTLSVGEYKCSDGTCAGDYDMLSTYNLYGTIQCFNDDVSCVLDGQSSRRGMYVVGTGSGKLTIRAIRFYQMKIVDYAGAGMFIGNGAKVDVILCVFDTCEITSRDYGGGGIYVKSGTVDIYATAFTGNSATSGNGDDIYNTDDGTVTIHDTCPSPYSANTPTQGK